jgi:hypothetical protein
VGQAQLGNRWNFLLVGKKVGALALGRYNTDITCSIVFVREPPLGSGFDGQRIGL